MHKHSQNHSHHHSAVKNIKIAFFLNFLFTIIEIAGGILTNSIAILSDAVHDLGDTFTLASSWYFEKISTKPRSESLTFGYKRYSLLGAVINSAVLLLGSAFILIESIPRIFTPEKVDVNGMIIIAVIGVFINGMAVVRLKGGHKLNERVVMLHLLEDVLGWVAVLTVGIVLKIKYLPVLDPVLSIVITVYILSKIYPNLKSALKIFLQYAPDDIDLRVIKNRIKKISYVKDIHDLHLWSIDGYYNVFSAHVLLSKDMNILAVERIKIEIKKYLHEIGIEHSTLEFEHINEQCENCDS